MDTWALTSTKIPEAQGTAGGPSKLCPCSPPASPGQPLWEARGSQRRQRLVLRLLGSFLIDPELRPQICHL